MNYEMISKLKVEELKSFLKIRNLKVSGLKEELIARVFVAVENNVQPVLTAMEVEDDLLKSYEKKLKIDGKSLPDPMKILHGWKGEEDGVVFWPMVTCFDIFAKLMFYFTLLNLVVRICQITNYVKRTATLKMDGCNHYSIIICQGATFV